MFNNQEVDFVCRKDNKTIYIQVTYYLNDDKTRKREYDSLLKINDNYPKYLLSLDRIDFSYKGIKHLNIIDFLKEIDNEI